MKRALLVLLVVAVPLILGAKSKKDTSLGCGNEAVSSTGIEKATATIETGIDGLTVEQRNVKERLERDNQPGSIKHLYVISPFSGDVLVYSTVRGKVTSSGKRLTPSTLDSDGVMTPRVRLGNDHYYTTEVMQDDGTYGHSAEYLFWFDSQGRYHQHYPGNTIVHVSDQPLSIGKAVLNLDPTFGDEAAVTQ
jgi:hypothetical protein